MTVPKCIIDMMETRTISEQLRLKLCKNLRITRLSQILLVLFLDKDCTQRNLMRRDATQHMI